MSCLPCLWGSSLWDRVLPSFMAENTLLPALEKGDPKNEVGGDRCTQGKHKHTRSSPRGNSEIKEVETPGLSDFSQGTFQIRGHEP